MKRNKKLTIHVRKAKLVGEKKKIVQPYVEWIYIISSLVV